MFEVKFINTCCCRYSIVGFSKFCLTLLAGFMIFNESVIPLQLVSMVITFSGKLWLTSEQTSFVIQLQTIFLEELDNNSSLVLSLLNIVAFGFTCLLLYL